MNFGSIDYASSYFKHKKPTPIKGVPAHEALKSLKMELQSNASSIGSDLGGGDHGCLGFVIIDEECASVPNTAPFVPLTCPAPLNMPTTATAIEALQLKDQRAERKGHG